MKTIWMLFFAVILSGCTSLKQYRTDYRVSSSATNHAHAAIIDTPEYLLGFVEFDDQGWLWDRAQLGAVTDRIIQENSKQPLLMIVFTHGWKHNSAPDDENVQMFRQLLKEMHKLERRRRGAGEARRIVGIYAGWRGLSVTPPLIRETSFWDRKDTAHEVGRGALQETLVELDAIRTNSRFLYPERSPTKLVVVGHSFGGAAVYSALAPLLMERMVDFIDRDGNARPPEGFGNLVVLINPAFEAARYKTLADRANSRTFFTNQPVTLAIFTATNDSATGFWFPLGRRLSTAFDAHRDRQQKQANIRTPGHYSELITHDLVPKAKQSKQEQKQRQVGKPEYAGEQTIDQSAAQVAEIVGKLSPDRTGKAKTTFSQVDLIPRSGYKPFSPLYNVHVEGSIIKGHGGIARERFITFLREFILAYTEK